MYFKIEKGTPLFTQMETVWKRGQECNEKARQACEKLGFETYGNYSSVYTNVVFGGIDFLVSYEKPKGYKTVDKKNGYYYPFKNNKEARSLIDNLPIVTKEEFNGLIGFETQHIGNTTYGVYGCSYKKDLFLIAIDDECSYTQVEGMEEIIYSKYKELNNNC